MHTRAEAAGERGCYVIVNDKGEFLHIETTGPEALQNDGSQSRAAWTTRRPLAIEWHRGVLGSPGSATLTRLNADGIVCVVGRWVAGLDTAQRVIARHGGRLFYTECAHSPSCHHEIHSGGLSL